MSGERTDRPTVDDEPLGTMEPMWRDEVAGQDPSADDDAEHVDDDAERTIEADPAWLAQLQRDAEAGGVATGDDERTIDVDADLLEHVRAAARAARDALAAPPSAPGAEHRAPVTVIDAHPEPPPPPGVHDPGATGVGSEPEPAAPPADSDARVTGGDAEPEPAGPDAESDARVTGGDAEPQPTGPDAESDAGSTGAESSVTAPDGGPDPDALPAGALPTQGADLWSPPPPGGVTSWLLAPIEGAIARPSEPAPPAEAEPAPRSEPVALPPTELPRALPPPAVPPSVDVAVAPPTEAAAVADPAPPPPIAPPSPTAAPNAAPNAAPVAATTPASGGRWQPPARLRPAEVCPSAPLLTERPPSRHHLDWRWAAAGIVIAAVLGFVIAMAVRGGDDAPDPAPGSTTVPGASTTVSTP